MLFASQFSCTSSHVFCFFLDATWFMIPFGVVTSVSLELLISFHFSSKMYEYQLLSKEFYFVQYIDIKTKCLFKPMTIAVEPKPWNDHRCWAMSICQGRMCKCSRNGEKKGSSVVIVAWVQSPCGRCNTSIKNLVLRTSQWELSAQSCHVLTLTSFFIVIYDMRVRPSSPL